MLENWMPIEGFNGYEVSDLGRVRSWRVRGHKGYRAKRPHIRKQWISTHGYPMVSMWKDSGVYRGVAIHVLVATAFIGQKPDGCHCCRHLNGNKTDNSVGNLAWGTYHDNEMDKERHGTRMKGESHHQAKLTAQQVLEIRYRRSAGETYSRIARDYDIDFTNVACICKRKTWRHLL